MQISRTWNLELVGRTLFNYDRREFEDKSVDGLMPTSPFMYGARKLGRQNWKRGRKSGEEKLGGGNCGILKAQK